MKPIPWHGWLWLPLAIVAMGLGVMHIFIDAGVRIFDLRGDLDSPEFVMVLGIPLIQVWFVTCFLAATHRRVGGILGIAVLCFLWVGMTNGYPIVYCPPTCKEAYPLTDVAHLGAVIVGPLAGLAALSGFIVQWRSRISVQWMLPLISLVLAIGTVVALAHTSIG